MGVSHHGVVALQVGSARVVTLPADPQSNKAERQLQVPESDCTHAR